MSIIYEILYSLYTDMNFIFLRINTLTYLQNNRIDF